MKAEDANCFNCYYQKYNECRRHAPISYQRPSLTGIIDPPVSKWPAIGFDDFCGDFERSEAAEIAYHNKRYPAGPTIQ